MGIAMGTMSWALMWTLSGCSGSSDAASDPADQHGVAAGWGGEQPSQKGLYRVTLSSEPLAPETGDLFVVTMTLTDQDGSPVEDATVSLDAQMPQHGHGMMTKTALIDEPHTGGVYRFEGFKFHMRGRWTLEATIEAPGGHDTHLAVFEQR